MAADAGRQVLPGGTHAVDSLPGARLRLVQLPAGTALLELDAGTQLLQVQGWPGGVDLRLRLPQGLEQPVRLDLRDGTYQLHPHDHAEPWADLAAELRRLAPP